MTVYPIGTDLFEGYASLATERIEEAMKRRVIAPRSSPDAYRPQYERHRCLRLIGCTATASTPSASSKFIPPPTTTSSTPSSLRPILVPGRHVSLRNNRSLCKSNLPQGHGVPPHTVLIDRHLWQESRYE